MQDWTPPWVEPLTIGDMLRRTAEKFPNRDAAVFTALDTTGQPFASPTDAGGDCFRYSYREFDAEVDRVAKALIGLGIEKGQHVAVWATNWPRWILLQYATARVGAVQVTVNPAYRASELSYVLKQSDAKALFLIDKFRTSDYFGLASEAVPELAAAKPGELSAADFPKLQHVVSMSDATGHGMRSWDDFMQLGDSVSDADLQAREATLTNEDPINIQYTSGTTGFPKGAMLSHRNLVLNAYYVGDCQRLSENDRICVPVPFYHCFGCVLGVLAAAAYGAALVTPAEYFNPESTLAAIEREKATALYGVPTMFIAQLESPEFAGRDLSSLRTGIMAGSPCPIEVMKRVVGDMGASEVTIAYGLTEASPVITQTRTDDPLELRVSTVGKMIPGIEVKIIDPETGASLGDEQQGELCTRGHVVMKGYYNNPDATAAAIDDEGWLHSGDLSVRLPNGYYRITGRIKDMICRGGENIYPREIEEFFYTHPAVQDVAVVGVPDPKFVEEVAAWIKLKDDATLTEDEILAFCKDNLSHFKIPRYIRFVDAFPQTVTGKIQKFKIRDLMIEELDLKQAETA
jgi:fatty-acyl-CoA synthase